jgi:hypothetical protein
MTIRYSGGYSYKEALLNPIADAVGEVAEPDTRVYFSLQVRTPCSSYIF